MGGQGQSTPLMEKGSQWRYTLHRSQLVIIFVMDIKGVREHHQRYSTSHFCCVGFQLHIVHIKEPYGSLAEAEHDMAGIALLAFLFEVIL